MACCCGGGCGCNCTTCTCGTSFVAVNPMVYAIAMSYHDAECCHTESVHDVTDYDMADDGRQALTADQKTELAEARRHWWQKVKL